MRVMMLLKSDAKSEAGVMPDSKVFEEMGAYLEALLKAGVLVSAEGLLPSTHGTRIRIAKGKTTITDGPFAEAKELVAGYFMLKTKSLAEAIEWAKKIPGAGEDESEIELRPLYETEDFPIHPAEQPGGWRDQEIDARQTLQAAGPDKGARYILFIKGDALTESGAAPSQKLLEEMGALIQEMIKKGVLVDGEGLKPTKEGAKLILSKTQRRVVDGPFTEAKEIVAGYTQYRAKTKEEAIEWARRTLQIHVDGTGVDFAEVEVRRVGETDEIPVAPDEQAGGWRDREKQHREQLSRKA